MHDHNKGHRAAQASPSIIATLVLQDTLSVMLELLEGMAQAGTLPVISYASHTRVGGQIPELIVSLVSHTPTTQPVVVVV